MTSIAANIAFLFAAMAGGLSLSSAPASATGEPQSSGCTAVNSGAFDTILFGDGETTTLGPLSFFAGEVISVEINVTHETNGGGSFHLNSTSTVFLAVSSGFGPHSGAVFSDDYTVTGVGDLSLGATIAIGNGIGTGSITTVVTCAPAPSGAIIIKKSAEGGDAEFDFTGDLGPFQITTSGGAGNKVFGSLAAGKYNVTETAEPGYDLTELSCTDPSGGTSTAEPTATISLAPGETVECTFTNKKRGSITIVKNTVGGDGEFDFTGDLGDFSITTVGGSGFETFSDVSAGTVIVTELGETGYVLSALGCDDGSSTEIGTATATIELAAGESVICTFTNTNVEGLTTSYIGGFLWNRAGWLMEAGPSFSHFIGRFYGTAENGLTFAPLAYQAIPNGGGAVAFDAMLAPDGSRWAIWAEGTYERYREGGPGTLVNGHVAMGQAGLDALVGDDVLLGLTIEGDAARELSTDFGYEVEGLGWMAGPYVALYLAEGVVLDAKFLWGKSTNNISPFLTYTDEFMTNRWLATARLAGEADIGGAKLRPEVAFMYFRETQLEYEDTNGITIPEQTIARARLTFGPEIAIPVSTQNGGTVEPSFSFEGVWDILTSDLYARLAGGLEITGAGGASLSLAGGYGGLFMPGFQNWHVAGNLTIPLR